MRAELNAIPVFIAVAEADSFTAAAEKLRLTRSAISKTIARLEAQLGVVLFMRTTRSLSLTDEGTVFYEHCRQAMEQIDTAEALLDSGKMQAQGRLRVAVPVLFGHRWIAPLLTELAMEQPQLMLEISFSDRIIDLMEEGFDLAVRIGKLPDSSSLKTRKLSEHRMLLCAAPSYLADFDLPQTIEDLNRHATLAYIRAGIIQKWIISDSKGNALAFRPQEKIVMDDIQALANTAVAGQGIAQLPDWLVQEDFAAGKLVEIMPGTQVSHFPIHVVWPYTPHLPLKTRLAIDRLSARIPAQLILKTPAARL